MNEEKKHFKRVFIYIAFAVILYTVVQNIGVVLHWLVAFLELFSPVTNGLCIAFVLNVLLVFLENKVFRFMIKGERPIMKKIYRPFCVAVCYLLALLLVFAVLLIVIPGVVDTVVYLGDNLPDYLNRAAAWIENKLGAFNIASDAIPDLVINWGKAIEDLTEYFTNETGDFFGEAVVITASLFNGVLNAIFSFIIAFYVLVRKETIGRFVKRALDAFLHTKITERIYRVASLSQKAFSNFIAGQLTESVILGVLCFLGMVLFGLPNAGIVSVIVCVTSLVPIVGTVLGEVIGVFLIFFISPMKALVFLVFILVLQQLEESIIYPRVVGNSVGLPGVLVISAVLVGGNAGGVFGALAGVPVCAVIYVLLKEAVAKRTKAKETKAPSDVAEE